MRMELGIDERLSNLRRFSNINTLRSLVLLDNYIKVIDELEALYKRISKQAIQKLVNIKRPDSMSLDQFAYLHFINEVGMEEYLNMLEIEQSIERLTDRQVRSRKKKAQLIWSKYLEGDEERHALLSELDSKMTARCQESRTSA